VQYEVEVGGRLRRVVVRTVEGRLLVTLDGREMRVDAVQVGGDTLSLLLGGESAAMPPGGVSREVSIVKQGPNGSLSVQIGQAAIPASFSSRRRWGRKEDSGSVGGPERVVAPMPGKVVRVLVSPGDTVRARQPIVVVEAMKMENELRAAHGGRVVEVPVRDGQPVEAGAVLAVISDS
jgi:biotin carboxyl carrier protein